MSHQKSAAEKALDAAKAAQARAQAVVDAERQKASVPQRRVKHGAPQPILVSKHDGGPAVVVAHAR